MDNQNTPESRQAAHHVPTREWYVEQMQNVVTYQRPDTQEKVDCHDKASRLFVDFVGQIAELAWDAGIEHNELMKSCMVRITESRSHLQGAIAHSFKPKGEV